MNTVTPPRAFQRHHHAAQPQNWAEVLARETRPVADYVKSFGTPPEGPGEVPSRWYTDPAIFGEEIEKIWKKKWQMVCRLDHIPVKGDTEVYNIAGLSFLIVRVGADEVKGYWNSCLHRGNPLRQCAGRAERLQCPFHGFTWNLDGTSMLIPHAEDFPQIDPENFSLPEVKIALWQGFVMMNPDLDAEPFESYIGNLDDQFQRFPMENREVSLQIRKTFPANWKVVQEAFMESFHVLTTHPQLGISSAGERCSDFGAEGNVSRGVVAGGHTSDYVSETPSEEMMFQRMSGLWDDETPLEDGRLPEGKTARQARADITRETFRSTLGDLVDIVTDAEAADVFYYTIFPNLHPFGLMQNLSYRFYPPTRDPEQCVMEITFLKPVREGQERSRPPQPIYLGAEEEFVEVKKLGSFGSFISQDSSNLAGIMMGLRNSQIGYSNFSQFHESKIRHFYSVYEKVMGLSAADEVGALKAARAASRKNAPATE